MRINVTQQDIDFGKPACGAACPITLAIKRAIPSALLIMTFTTWMEITHADGTYESYNLPPSAKEFIAAYDVSRRILTSDARPFSFEIEGL